MLLLRLSVPTKGERNGRPTITPHRRTGPSSHSSVSSLTTLSPFQLTSLAVTSDSRSSTRDSRPTRTSLAHQTTDARYAHSRSHHVHQGSSRQRSGRPCGRAIYGPIFHACPQPDHGRSGTGAHLHDERYGFCKFVPKFPINVAIAEEVCSLSQSSSVKARATTSRRSALSRPPRQMASSCGLHPPPSPMAATMRLRSHKEIRSTTSGLSVSKVPLHPPSARPLHRPPPLSRRHTSAARSLRTVPHQAPSRSRRLQS